MYPWQKDDWKKLQPLRSQQALLLYGQRGIGKLELAVDFARALLCEHPQQEGLACGKCASCHWFGQGSHPDYRILQPESETEEVEAGKKPSRQISVDQIRSLYDFLGMTAHQGGRRIAIVSPAEAMNVNAANALLKSLEEPPPGLLFILVAHKPQALLPTIRSRCISFALSPPGLDEAFQFLASRGIANPGGALAAAGYSPLEALEQGEGMDVREKLMRALENPGDIDVFALADALHKTEQGQVVQWLQQWSYDLLSQKMAGRLRYNPGKEKIIAEIVSSIDALDLARLQSVLKKARKEAQHTLNAKLFFESLLFTYCNFTRPCHS